MGLLRMIFWVALFVASTFAFTVLFEYGISNYSENARHEWEGWMKLVQKADPKKP